MMDLFITKLDEEYLVVLGYNWLTQHNPSIDWVETKITFQVLRKGRTPEKLPSLTPEAIDICLVSERTMKKLSQETGSTTFLLSPIDTLWPACHGTTSLLGFLVSFPLCLCPCPISITFRLHLTSSACLPPPPLQLRGVLVQLCYIHTRTSLRLTSDLLGPDSCAKGYHLYTSYNLSDPFFIINNG